MASKYFPAAAEATSAPEHPRIRSWISYRAKAGGPIRVQVWREHQAFGSGPPSLHVDFLDPQKNLVHQAEAPWSAVLDNWLVDQGATAITAADEALRFSLRLKESYAPLWQEWGDGYFNSVLVHTLREGLAEDASVRATLSAITEYRPNDGPRLARSIQDIDAVVSARARELVASLKYDRATAESILGAAVATYLNDRFHIGERHHLLGVRGPSVSPKKIAALALADALERVLRAEGGEMPSSYFYDARKNIEVGDDVSVDVNWQHIVDAIGEALPNGYIPTETKDRIRTALELKLAAHDPAVVEAACELLANTVGGDPQTWRIQWGRGPR